MSELKFISVVIPTFNRKSMLKLCLESFNKQSYPVTHFEVLVIDDGSSDGTEEFIEGYREHINFKLIYYRQKNGGPAAARNRGVKEAKGALVAFTDDDCVVDEHWLAECNRSFNESYIGGAGGVIVQKTSGTISDYLVHIKALNPPAPNGEPYYLVTANACYRRDVLLEVGGFEEAIKNPGGEDPDLSMKVKEKGYKLRFNPDNIVYHFHKSDIRSFYKTYFNYGRGSHYICNKWGNGVFKEPEKMTFLNFLSLSNLKLIRKYYREAGVKYALPFWFLQNIQMLALSRGFQKGY